MPPAVTGHHRGDRHLHRHRAGAAGQLTLSAPDAVGQHLRQRALVHRQPVAQVSARHDAAVVAGQAHQRLVDLQHVPLRINHRYRVAGARERMRHQLQRFFSLALRGHVLQRAQHPLGLPAAVTCQRPATHPQPALPASLVVDAEADVDVGMGAAPVQLPGHADRRRIVGVRAVEKLRQREAVDKTRQRRLFGLDAVHRHPVGGGVPFPHALAAGPQRQLHAALGGLGGGQVQPARQGVHHRVHQRFARLAGAGKAG